MSHLAEESSISQHSNMIKTSFCMPKDLEELDKDDGFLRQAC